MLRLTTRQLRLLIATGFVLVLVQWYASPSSEESASAEHFDWAGTHHHNSSDTWRSRSEEIRQAFVHAYAAYEKSAFPADELQPLTEKGTNNLNGWGLTTIDAIDTMVIMDLKPEYERALDHVKSLRMADTNAFVPFFETTIRYLGGFLAAYTLTSEQIFLTRADELGQILLPAFKTPGGLPNFYVNPSTKEAKTGPNGRRAALAEIASHSLEFGTLAKLTGRNAYADAVGHVTEFLQNGQQKDGLWPTAWDIESVAPLNTEIAVGGNADSAYEYLLKQWLSDPTSKSSRKMYIRASNAIISNLLYLSPNRHLLYATDLPNAIPSGKLEHLTCFLPGLLALGVHTLHEHLTLRERRTHMYAAEGLAQTCYLIAKDSATGLAPDEVVFSRWPKDEIKAGKWVDALAEWERKGESRWRKGGVWGGHEEADKVPPGVRTVKPAGVHDRDYWLRRPENVLRPETVESLYLLHKITKDPKWREMGWEVCSAFLTHSRTASGAFSSIRRVDNVPVRFSDSMPSWFLAETLKYCFLLTSDKDLLPLDKFVSNTEAHPLPRWSWDGWRKKFPNAKG